MQGTRGYLLSRECHLPALRVIDSLAPIFTRAASTSTYVDRVTAEQAAIEARLVELVGVETIRNKLAHTSIHSDDAMNIDTSPTPQQINRQPQPIPTKAKILAAYVSPLLRAQTGHCDLYCWTEPQAT